MRRRRAVKARSRLGSSACFLWQFVWVLHSDQRARCCAAKFACRCKDSASGFVLVQACTSNHFEHRRPPTTEQMGVRLP